MCGALEASTTIRPPKKEKSPKGHIPFYPPVVISYIVNLV